MPIEVKEQALLLQIILESRRFLVVKNLVEDCAGITGKFWNNYSHC